MRAESEERLPGGKLWGIIGFTARPVAAYLVLLLVVVAPLFGLGLSNHGLWTADEPRVAEIGREMALSGNLAVPTLNQKPFLEQPPLYYAAMAAVFRILGASDRVARLPSAIFALAGVIALFFLANMLFGPRVGFLSGFIMATSGEYFRVAHWVIVDGAMASFVIIALTFFMVAYVREDRGKKILFYCLCYLFCGLAFYTKGFIGIAIPGLAVLAFLVFDRNLKEIFRMRLWLGIVIFLVMTLPWFLALWVQGGDEFLRTFLIHNHLERFAGGSTGHNQPFYYYLAQFPLGFLPWSLLIVPVVYRSFRKAEPGQEGASRKGMLFTKCWFIAGFLFLSAASTKRVLYLMPLFAPAAMLTACYIDSTLKKPSFRWFEKSFAYLFGLVPLLLGLAIVPLYLYFLKKYAVAASTNMTIVIACFCLVAAALALAALNTLRRSLVERFWAFSGASLFSLLLLVLTAVIPLIDPFKSFVPFSNAVSAAVPASASLYAYKPDETLRGALPFYTGRFLTEIDTLSSLEAAASKEKTAYIVVRDSKGRMEKEILSTGRFSVLAKGMDARRSLVLFAFREAPDRGN